MQVGELPCTDGDPSQGRLAKLGVSQVSAGAAWRRKVEKELKAEEEEDEDPTGWMLAHDIDRASTFGTVARVGSRSSRVRIRRCGHGCALVLCVLVLVCSVPYVTSSGATDLGADRSGGGPGVSRPSDHAARIPAVPVREPDVPQIQFINRVLGIPVVPQRQVFTVPNCAEYGRLHWCSAWVRLLPRPSLCNDRCRVVQTVQKTVWRCRCCSLLTRLSTSLLWRRGISLWSRSSEDDRDSSVTVHRHGGRRSCSYATTSGSQLSVATVEVPQIRWF